MATTNFTDNATLIVAEWLNEVDNLVHDIFGNPADAATALTALGGAALGTNVFTSTQHIAAATPNFVLRETDAAANNQDWFHYASGEALIFATAQDGGPAGDAWCTVQRTGTTVDSVTLSATDVSLGNFKFNADQTVGAGQDNFVLTYDNGTGEIGLEAAAGGGGITVQDEGTPLATDADTLNFVGAGVTATGAGGTKTITIPGGGSGIADIVEDTTPQLGGQLDVNGQAIGDGTLELLTFTETASAVNHVNLTNATTTNGPTIGAAGDDTNIDLNIAAKGTGNITIGTLPFNADQTVGAGQDNFVLTYDQSTGLINLEATQAPTGVNSVTTVYKTADTVRTNTAVIAADPHLTFTNLTAGRYAFEAYIVYDSPAAADLHCRYLATGHDAVNSYRTDIGTPLTGTPEQVEARTVLIGDTLEFEADNSRQSIFTRGIIEFTSGTNTFEFAWAQDTANASASQVEENSYIKLTRLV